MNYRKTDIFLCLFFVLFWLVPLFYSNLTQTKVPFVPKFVAALYSTSNLFTQANDIWPMPYMQVLTAQSPQWKILGEADYFQMQTFGYRTRLFEALYLAVDDPAKSLAVQKELARWVARRYATLNPGENVREVRFVAGLHAADSAHPPKGRWHKPPLETFSPEMTYTLSTHTIGGRP